MERDDGRKRLGGLGLGVTKRAGKTPPLPAGPQPQEERWPRLPTKLVDAPPANFRSVAPRRLRPISWPAHG